MTTPWRQRYALRTHCMGSSTIRELLKLTMQPDMISFAGGLPAPELFPVEELRAATDRVLTRFGSQALQYSTTEGYEPLRRWIVDNIARYGIKAAPDNVLVTSGSQQALDLIGKILINPGDVILTEEPTYLGALQAWRAYQAEYISLPMDQDGLRTELLESAFCAGPKFMYILPNFQNPAGVTLARARREELVAQADRYGIPIIEDDPYGALRFTGEHLPPLVVLDAASLGGDRSVSSGGYLQGNVIYLSTFSKTLAPGLRLGWMLAPVDVIKSSVMAKQGMDLHTSSFVQMVAYEMVRDGFLEGHVRQIRAVYRHRRDVMLQAMAVYFPDGVSWTEPEGGLFLWVTLPPALDAGELVPLAAEKRVAFVPGSCFFPDGSGRNTLRLNFSNARPEQIVEGIRRLADVLQEAMAPSAPAEATVRSPALA